MNLSRLTLDEKKRLLVSMSRLKRDANFIQLADFLSGELSEKDKQLRRAKDAFAVIQGQAQTIEALLSLVEKSEDTLNEIKKTEAVNTGR